VRTFEKQAAQGDVLFRRVDTVPADAKSVDREKDGSLVCAHSETGHHHSFPKDSGATLYTTGDPMVCYLSVEAPSLLEHQRPHDTHEAILFAPGCYEMRRQREHTPEGWRRVED
jgi:hypothetical protein